MTCSYNLLENPWIPCIDAEGDEVVLSLREVLAQAHTLHDVSGESPLTTVAIYRLLLAIAHRVFGPDGMEAWAALWDAGQFDMTLLDAYLSQWHDRFDLFHPEHPFYQQVDPRLKPKPITTLLFDAASGNNATLFDHHTDAEGLTLTAAQATRALLAAQAFGLAGLCLPGNPFTDAPCARGIGFLIQGETVYETVMLNLVAYDEDRPMPRYPDDCPAWEMDDPYRPRRSIPRGYLDYLTWQNRRVLLLPEVTGNALVVRSITVAPGLRLDPTITDPQKHYHRDEKRGLLLPLRFDESRALWRDSAALLSLATKEYQPPRALNWLADLVGNGYLPAQRRRMLALGMANNQAKVEFFRTERWPLPLKYLEEPALVEALKDALAMAEGVSNQLWGAGRTLATFFLCPEADLEGAHQPAPDDLNRVTGQWDMRRRYWAELEAPFRLMLEDLPEGPETALSTWQATLRRAAWQAFDGIARNLDAQPRTLKAAVRGRQQLASGLVKVFGAQQTESQTRV